MTKAKAVLEQRRQATEYLRAVHQPLDEDRRDVMQRPTWVPAPWQPARPGADDHKKHKSLGVR